MSMINMLPKQSPPIPALDQTLTNIDPTVRIVLMVAGAVVFGVMFYLLIRRKRSTPADTLLFCKICNKMVVRRADAIRHVTLRHSVDYKKWCDHNNIFMAAKHSEFTALLEWFFTKEPEAPYKK